MLAMFRPTYRIAIACNVRMTRPDASTTVVRIETHARSHAITTSRHTVERLHRSAHGVERLVHALAAQTRIPARREDEERAAFPRVQSTMLRTRATQPPANAGAPDASAPRGNHADEPRALAIPRSSPPPPLPASELSRVTEHVLRQLDRRVLSYRERTGQI